MYLQTVSITNVKGADSQRSKAAQQRQKGSPQVEFSLLHHNGGELCSVWQLALSQSVSWMKGRACQDDGLGLKTIRS